MAKDRTLKVRILGDASGAKKALNEVDRAADKTAGSTSRLGKIGDALRSNLDRLGLSGVGAGKSVAGFDDKLKKAEKSAAGAGASTAGLATAGTAAAAGLALAAAGAAAAAQKASDLNEQVAASEVVFGEAADRAQDFAKSADDAFGLSQRAALEALNAFGGLFTNLGLGQREAAVFSEGLVSLSADLASFKNVAGGSEEVLLKLRAGLNGEAEPLRSLGIFLDEAKTKAKAFELGLQGPNGELSDGAKILARYQLILDQTSNAQGDFARTSESLANQQRIQQAQMENLQASIGKLTAPALTGLTAALNDTLRPAAGLADTLGGAGGGLADGAKAFGQIALGIPGIVSGVGDAIDKLRGKTDDATGPQEKLNEALQRYAELRADSSSTSQEVASALSAVRSASQGVAAQQDEITKALKGEAEAAKDAAKAIDGIVEAQIAAINAQLGYERSTRAVTDAQAAYTEALAAGGKGSKEAKEAENNLAQAKLRAKQATLAADEAQRAYNAAVAEHGKSSDESVAAGLRLEAARLALTEANEDAREAEDELADALKGGGANSKEAEEAAVRLKEAMVAQAAAAVRLADDQAKANGSALDAAAKNEVFRAKLLELAAVLAPGSPLRTQLEAFAAGIKGLPEAKSIALNLDTSKAEADLRRFLTTAAGEVTAAVNLKTGGRVLAGDDVPRFHSGGMYRAPTPGGEGYAILKDRELVLAPAPSPSSPWPRAQATASAPGGSAPDWAGLVAQLEAVRPNVTLNYTPTRDEAGPEDVIRRINMELR